MDASRQAGQEVFLGLPGLAYGRLGFCARGLGRSGQFGLFRSEMGGLGGELGTPGLQGLQLVLKLRIAGFGLCDACIGGLKCHPDFMDGG